MGKEIMLNKSFIGSWGVESDGNIPHEIINLFKSDNGNTYIYVPPYGGFQTDEHNDIEYLLLTGSWNNNMTEVLYLVEGLTLLHHGGKKATVHDRKCLEEYIKANDITYGGKYLHEIPMSEKDEDKVFYLTFKADSVRKPTKQLFLSWTPGTEEHDDKKDVYVLSESYNYQRQFGYIPAGDYDTVRAIITSPNRWCSDAVVEKVNVSAPHSTSHTNFLKLIHKEYDETIFTNLFYEFFNATPALFAEFTKAVLGITENDNFTIRKEVTTEDGRGRLDLLVEGNATVVAIENKINSGLNGIDKHNELSQLTTYIEFVEKNILNGRKAYYFLFEPNYNDIDISKFDKKRGCEFVKISYGRIYQFMKEHRSDLVSTPFGRYANDFIDALYTHTLLMRDIVEQRFIEAIQTN